MLLDVSGEDLRKQLFHIKKTLKGGPKSILYIEIYDDSMLLVYRNIELPVKIFNPSGTKHKLISVYTIKNYALLYKLINTFKNMDIYQFDFYPNFIKIKIETSQVMIKAEIYK